MKKVIEISLEDELTIKLVMPGALKITEFETTLSGAQLKEFLQGKEIDTPYELIKRKIQNK